MTLSRDERTAVNPTGRRELYRFQVQGPTALDVLTKANGGSLPEIKFFNMGELTIGGHKVRALHHGMSGVPGLELLGPVGRAGGRARGDRRGRRGLRAPPGRLPRLRDEHARVRLDPLPAARPIFTGDELKAYREWLPADGYEGTGSLGGSYYSDDISDYYRTPHELGYWPFVKFDHDFIGREALEAMADEPTRQEGHARVERRGRRPARWARCSRRATPVEVHRPAALELLHLAERQAAARRRARRPLDLLRLQLQRALVCCRSAMVDVDVEFGAEVTLVWGEEDGGSSKPVVERHVQAEIRAIVSPVPVLGGRAHVVPEGWRTKAGVA